MANSVDPDHTAPKGVWSGSTLFAQTCLLENLGSLWYLSHVTRKTVSDICKQQRRRSACASVQSDQRLCYSLLRYYNISSFYIQNFKPLASLCSWADRFESYLVKNPEDRFSRDEAHFIHCMNRVSNIDQNGVRGTLMLNSSEIHAFLW